MSQPIRGSIPGKNPLQEVLLELEKMKTRFDNLTRNGEISDVKYDKDKKRWYVKYKEEGHDNPFETDWRPWKSFSHGSISASIPPRKGMKATMCSPGGYPEQSYVEQYHYGPDTPSPHDKEDEVVVQIQKPKQKDQQNQQGGSSGSGGAGSLGGLGGGSSGTDESDGGPDTPNKDDDPTWRFHVKNDTMTVTVGKVGKSEDASAQDGDGSDGKKDTTFQMTVTRQGKTITCGKFKAVLGKEGAKMTWGDKVSLELKDGQIQTIVDKVKHTLTADNIKSEKEDMSLTIDDQMAKFSGGKVKHDDRNIGKDHVHSGVMPDLAIPNNPKNSMLIEKPVSKFQPKKVKPKAPTSPYTVLTAFWHAGLLRAEGEIVHLTDVGAKYLSHIVEPVKAIVDEVVDAPKALLETAVATEKALVASIEDKAAKVVKALDPAKVPADAGKL